MTAVQERRCAVLAALLFAASTAGAHHIMPPDAAFSHPAPGAVQQKNGKPLTAADVAAVIGAKALPRSTVNRADDSAQPQVKVWYVLPSDGADEGLDTNGAIAKSVAVGLNWLRGQTGGRTFRVDTHNGDLDIGFFRMAKTDAQIAATGAFVRDEIEAALDAAGLTQANRLDLVYYGGSSMFAGGGGAAPQFGLVGSVGALYLKGVIPGFLPCGANPLAPTETSPPGYWEFSWVHEMTHVMGFVAACAPHQVLNGHVGDSPTDLMYAGTQPWVPSVLDLNRDDYFGHGRAGCADLANAAYLKSVDESNALIAIEYFHTGFSHYFITALAAEIAALDGGQFAGWQRTGRAFRVWTSGAGLAGVCRFFTTAFAPKSSHFYTPDTNE
ncbi:MAG: hypothetical protein ABI812_01010, partial [Betaproteobacteria bacterium]